MPPLSMRAPTLPAMTIEAEGAWLLPQRPANEDDELIGYEAALPFLRHDTVAEGEAASA